MLLQVEAALSSSNYVENIMVYADPFHNFCVALVVPSRQALEGWANESGVKFSDFSELCEKEEAKKEVQQSLAKVCPCLLFFFVSISFQVFVCLVYAAGDITGRKSSETRQVRTSSKDRVVAGTMDTRIRSGNCSTEIEEGAIEGQV